MLIEAEQTLRLGRKWKLKRKLCHKELARLHFELVKLQEWVM